MIKYEVQYKKTTGGFASAVMEREAQLMGDDFFKTLTSELSNKLGVDLVVVVAQVLK